MRNDEGGIYGNGVITRGILSQAGDYLTIEIEDNASSQLLKSEFKIISFPHRTDTSFDAGGNQEHYTMMTTIKKLTDASSDPYTFALFKIK